MDQYDDFEPDGYDLLDLDLSEEPAESYEWDPDDLADLRSDLDAYEAEWQPKKPEPVRTTAQRFGVPPYVLDHALSSGSTVKITPGHVRWGLCHVWTANPLPRLRLPRTRRRGAGRPRAVTSCARRGGDSGDTDPDLDDEPPSGRRRSERRCCPLRGPPGPTDESSPIRSADPEETDAEPAYASSPPPPPEPLPRPSPPLPRGHPRRGRPTHEAR